uniref:Progestin and adipoQ receptor family member 4 n=1 Tax=Timema cristinae TaxID=61476 RepID=A0A7R9GV32_TIMCR|nr:unnamed protein product [Timema cristinae]
MNGGVPIVYILLTVPALIPWEQVDSRFLPWCHVAGAVSPWIGSFLYHLFMNLDRGEMIYYRLLQLDMLGIWWMYSPPSVVPCFQAMTAWSPWERRLCFLLPFMMRVLLFILRNSSYGGGDPTGMMHVVLQDGVSAIGGMVGALHIPEKWFPGTMDFYLNSHNIMHVLVVMAVYSMHQATVRDLVWMTQVDCEARHLTLRGYQINFEL